LVKYFLIVLKSIGVPFSFKYLDAVLILENYRISPLDSFLIVIDKAFAKNPVFRDFKEISRFLVFNKFLNSSKEISDCSAPEISSFVILKESKNKDPFLILFLKEEVHIPNSLLTALCEIAE
jgi:hypothetical protein